MTSEVFIEQLRNLDVKMHYHDCVWWKAHAPFYYKPALEFQEIKPGAARPSVMRALAGYSHMVPAGVKSNRSLFYEIYEHPEGVVYEINSLISKKRNQVRKGLRCCEIRRIEELESHIESLKEINIIVRERIGVGLPATYYTEHFSEWRRRMLTYFHLPNRDWWGAFVGGRLMGYYYSYAIEEMLVIDTAKVHTDALSLNASDALVFTLIEDAINRKGCRRIVYGDWTPDDERLTRFKEQYGFIRKEYPAFLSVSARLALWVRNRLVHKNN